MGKFFFSMDGSWGDAEGISIVDTDGLDDHFGDYIECVREYDLAEWSAWFAKNNHAMPEDAYDYECYYCDNYLVGSLAEIDAKFAK